MSEPTDPFEDADREAAYEHRRDCECGECEYIREQTNKEVIYEQSNSSC